MGFEKEASTSAHTLTVPSGADDSECPLLVPQSPSGRHLSSQSKTFANVFIAIVGAGVLGLPYTFMRTGWIAGAVMVLVVAALTYHCMMLLVMTRRRLESDQWGVSKISSFGDLGFAVCGPMGRLAVDVMIVLSQAGFCVSYVIFIATTLVHIFNSSSSSQLLGLVDWKAAYVWVMFPFQLGLNSIPTLTHLAPLSIFADVVDVGAMGVVMVEDVLLYLQNHPPLQAFTGVSAVFYGLGVAVYAFEGVGMVLPLETEAADKSKFGRTLGLSMLLISIMYGLFGVLGYAAFGTDTRDIITTNLGSGLATTLVQLGLCINLFFTFPLMMNPVHEVFERRLAGKRFSLWIRWAAVLVVALVALTVPNFADFLSLVGSSVCCTLGFVLPALFHLRVFRDDMGLWAAVADVGIIVVGIVFAVYGTYSSLVEIFSVKS